jgi:hypothetical protein
VGRQTGGDFFGCIFTHIRISGRALRRRGTPGALLAGRLPSQPRSRAAAATRRRGRLQHPQAPSFLLPRRLLAAQLRAFAFAGAHAAAGTRMLASASLCGARLVNYAVTRVLHGLNSVTMAMLMQITYNKDTKTLDACSRPRFSSCTLFRELELHSFFLYIPSSCRHFVGAPTRGFEPHPSPVRYPISR